MVHPRQLRRMSIDLYHGNNAKFMDQKLDCDRQSYGPILDPMKDNPQEIIGYLIEEQGSPETASLGVLCPTDRLFP